MITTASSGAPPRYFAATQFTRPMNVPKPKSMSLAAMTQSCAIAANISGNPRPSSSRSPL